jgi:hypothetical protein
MLEIKVGCLYKETNYSGGVTYYLVVSLGEKRVNSFGEPYQKAKILCGNKLFDTNIFFNYEHNKEVI